jgi:3-isopropylmalate/(R)-2-methylmalate dehydratase small subunit
MFADGLDVIGLSLAYKDRIEGFRPCALARQPWLRDMASSTMKRL